MVLHHFGDSTLSDVKEVEKECVAAGAKTVVVAGDIAKPETAKDVSLPSSDSFRSFPFETRHQVLSGLMNVISDTIPDHLAGLRFR
jgi:hypothetical protein